MPGRTGGRTECSTGASEAATPWPSEAFPFWPQATRIRIKNHKKKDCGGLWGLITSSTDSVGGYDRNPTGPAATSAPYLPPSTRLPTLTRFSQKGLSYDEPNLFQAPTCLGHWISLPVCPGRMFLRWLEYYPIDGGRAVGGHAHRSSPGHNSPSRGIDGSNEWSGYRRGRTTIRFRLLGGFGPCEPFPRGEGRAAPHALDSRGLFSGGIYESPENPRNGGRVGAGGGHRIGGLPD